MLQRNPHPDPLDVPAIPATVQPGETVDWPDPIAGFDPVPDPDPAPVPKTAKRAAASAATTEEQQA